MAVCEAEGMRTLAILFGLVVLAGVVVMAVAGFQGAVTVLWTGAGIVGMVVLGTRLGGRHATRPGTGDGPGASGGDRPV